MKNFIFKPALVPVVIIVFFSLKLSAQENKVQDHAAQRAALQSSDNWFSNAQKFLETSSCNFTGGNGKFVAANSNEKLSFSIEGSKMRIAPLFGENFAASSIKLNNISKNNTGKLFPGHAEVFQKDNYLRYQYNGFSIEYISGMAGLRQNFIINNKPEGAGELTVSLSVSGDLVPRISEDGTLLLADHKNKSVLHYDDLMVWDATNKKLHAFMKKTGTDEIQIIVNDRNAVYPVTIDPLTHAEEWITSANGILSGLTSTQQIDAVYGYTVYGLGDINADGYDDAAIGAPLTVAILPGPVTVAGAGAVFIYFGSATGLPAAPSRTLRSSVPVANALFGYSIASGNVTGNTKKDIIIGAPGESYTATVSSGIIIPPTINATVTAGKIYLYDGQTITGAGPYTSSSLFLDGAVYFSNGLAGILSSNLTVNALFGFSVAATEDMTGDGLGEIVVGAPGYADAQLLLVKTGAAFIYYSGNITSNTPTRLDPPALLSFPSLPLLNLNGLLFGFSVDGAGDYNKDTRPDVVVGAPGGLNLGLDGFLGGSAYVFTGRPIAPGPGGINTTAGVRLTSSTGITGSIANLFGYKVKGLKNNSGVRSGNILTSSPVTNVVSNIINGLRLKSGDVNIFTAKLSPASTETPVQSLSSPRGTTLPAILTGQDLNVSLLFGAAADNMGDADCDGFSDLIVGEPLSTSVGLISTNAVGGAAYIFRGKPDGTFFTTPYWTLENSVSFDAGVNAGSLLGYSVSGIGAVSGTGNGIRALVGAPGAALDFSTGILNLGNTLGTTLDFAAGGNGPGKAYTYNFNNCAVVPVTISEFGATAKNCDALITWKTGAETGLIATETEQSADGIHFTAVKRTENSGTGENQYSVTVSQKNMVMYYRLKLVQNNNAVIYSSIKKVKTDCGKTDELQVYPTLFNNEVKVIYSSATAKGNAVVIITDIAGRKVITRPLNVLAGDNQTTIAGAVLPPGVYYVQISGENYRSETLKIVRR